MLIDHVVMGEQEISGNSIPDALKIAGYMGDEELPLGTHLSHDVEFISDVPQQIYGPYMGDIKLVELWKVDGEFRNMIASSDLFEAKEIPSVKGMTVDHEYYDTVTGAFNIEPYNLITIEREVGCWSYVFENVETAPKLSDFTIIRTNCAFGEGVDEFIDNVLFWILLDDKMAMPGEQTETDNEGATAFAVMG